MNDIQFEPIGKRYLTPFQKRERYIKYLEHWVIAFAATDIILVVLIMMLLCEVMG